MLPPISFGGALGPPPLEYPDPDAMARQLASIPPDPTLPIYPRPTREILLERKRVILRYWRERNVRMLDDEALYKMLRPPEHTVGGDTAEIGAAETFIGNDPYTLVEKVANMVAQAEPNIEHISEDPGLGDISQKIKDFLVWWREEADDRWYGMLNNTLPRDEVYFLALRGWVSGRIILDPNDTEWPYRYDLVDPINVYPKIGNKGVRWVFNVYRDSKSNIINDMGFDQETLDRIEAQLGALSEYADIEVASYWDDHWHVMFMNNIEVWSAPHNYGFLPWVIGISFGPPTRRSDPLTGIGIATSGTPHASASPMYTRWWGVSIFTGIKDTYEKTNKLISAVMTELMKAPNPPLVIYTSQAGEAEGKTIDTSIGATSYLLKDQEKFEPVQYGFRPDQLMPVIQILKDQQNRGTLPDVMYGQGAQYMSGFAVNLLQGGARDILLPIVKSHERFLSRLYRIVLQMTAEILPLPIQMVETDPQDGERRQLTTLDPSLIKLAGYRVQVRYKNIGPQDKQQQAAVANLLVQSHIISPDTARGNEFLGLKNPTLENEKVLAALAYQDPDVVKASIPLALYRTNPELAWIYMQTQWQKFESQMQQLQMMAQMGGGPPRGGPPSPPPPGGPPPSGGPHPPPHPQGLPNHVLPHPLHPGHLVPPPPVGAEPQTGPV